MSSHLINCGSRKRGFSLIEVLMVIGIIALLASIAVPSYQRARRRSQALRILDDLKVIDSALEQYALEFNKSHGATATFTDLQPYFKPGSALRITCADLFGYAYGPYSVDFIPKLGDPTFNQLSDVAEPAFWSPFR